MGGTETNPLYGEDSFLVNLKFSAGNPLELLLGKQVSFVPGEPRVTSMCNNMSGSTYNSGWAN